MQEKDYIQFIADIKQNILQSRYKATSLANKEMLLLYYSTGKRLSEKIEKAKWGAKVIRNISSDLQNELPGLRGFSYSNLQNMKKFFEEYYFLSDLINDFESDNENNAIVQLPTAQLHSEFVQMLSG